MAYVGDLYALWRDSVETRGSSRTPPPPSNTRLPVESQRRSTRQCSARFVLSFPYRPMLWANLHFPWTTSIVLSDSRAVCETLCLACRLFVSVEELAGSEIPGWGEAYT